MNGNQSNVHTYPMKKQWQTANRVIGFWSWGIAFVRYSLAIIFQRGRGKKIIPAFRQMMAGKAESYLQVSVEGLAYRNWPLYEIGCGWQDVNHLKKGGLLGDVLCLKRADKKGHLEFSILLGQPQIHLSSLVGWRDGELEDDLRQNAPHLFDLVAES